MSHKAQSLLGWCPRLVTMVKGSSASLACESDRCGNRHKQRHELPDNKMSETQDAHVVQGAGQAAAAELKAVLIERLCTSTSSAPGASTGALLRALRLCVRFLSHARGSREELATREGRRAGCPVSAGVRSRPLTTDVPKACQRWCRVSAAALLSHIRCRGLRKQSPPSARVFRQLQALQAPY